ncbi:endonuclease/exonuclease/phosphatase family protein [Nonomuraea sp. NPDC004297]
MIGRRCGGTRLLVAATAAWTAFLVLHVLLAGDWWPWVIFEMTPPLTAVAVPLLLLAFVWRARPVRRPLSVVLVLLLLAGGYLAGYGRGWTSPAAAGPQGAGIKVFAWNTGYWEMENNPDAFFTFLRQQDADVYLLQEHLYAIRNDTPYNEVIRIDATPRLRTEFPGYQISIEGEFVTMSRLPIVAEHRQTVSSTGDDWFWKGPKFQRTEIQVGGRPVSFYNVHLPGPYRDGNPLTAGFYERQVKQSLWRYENLSRLRADVAANPLPTVLAGDFNSPWTELYSFRPGIRAHGPPGALAPLHTWPLSNFAFPRMWRLDWLYTSGDLAVPSYHLDGGGKVLSDHAAQEFRVVVPEQKGGVT